MKDIVEKLMMARPIVTIGEKGSKYIAWNDAWIEMLKVCPDAEFVESENPIRHCEDGTASVEMIVRFSVEGRVVERKASIPVLSEDGKEIRYPTSKDINTSQMRCVVKVLMTMGLSMNEGNIYDGLSEDEIAEKMAKEVAKSSDKKERKQIVESARAAAEAAKAAKAAKAEIDSNEEGGK